MTNDFAGRISEWIRVHERRVPGILHWLQIATGLVLLGLAWHMGRTPFDLIRAGSRTTGQVIRFEYVSGGRSSYSAFHPVVEFEVDGRRFRFKDRFGSASAGGIHDAVPVMFDPQEPSVAAVDRPLLNWIPWAPVFAVGAFLLLVGAIGKVREARP